MRPVFSSPARAHVLPASFERYIPQPSEMWLRMNDSPVPIQTTFGSDGETATAPMLETGRLSVIGRQCVPASSVFQRPPLAAPA